MKYVRIVLTNLEIRFSGQYGIHYKALILPLIYQTLSAQTFESHRLYQAFIFRIFRRYLIVMCLMFLY